MRPINILDLNNAQQDVTHIAEIATSAQATAVDRLGQRKRTISGVVADAALSAETKAGAAMAAIQGVITDATFAVEAAASASMASIGYQPPVAYGAGISITARTQTVSYAGQVFGPNLADIPFTTSGTFESTKFRLISGVTAADLAAASGAALVGNGGESVKESLDALQLPDYAALRAYKGPRKSVYVTGVLGTVEASGIAGTFVLKGQGAPASADNGGTVIVGASGRIWKRVIDNSLSADWFGASTSASASTNIAAIQAAIKDAHAKGGMTVTLSGGDYEINDTILLYSGVRLKGQGLRVTKIKLANGANIDMLQLNPVAHTVRGTCAVEGLVFDGNLANNTKGGIYLNCNLASYINPLILIEDVEVRNASPVTGSTLYGAVVIEGGERNGRARNFQIYNCLNAVGLWHNGSDWVFHELYAGNNGSGTVAAVGGQYYSMIFGPGQNNLISNAYLGGNLNGDPFGAVTGFDQVWIRSARNNRFVNFNIDTSGRSGVVFGKQEGFPDPTGNTFVGGQISNSSATLNNGYPAVNFGAFGGNGNIFSAVDLYNSMWPNKPSHAVKDVSGAGENLLIGCNFDTNWATGVDGRWSGSSMKITGCVGFAGGKAFAPTLVASGGGVASYNNQTGWCIKENGMAHFHAYLNVAGHTGNGTMKIGSLPFTARNTPALFAAVTIGYVTNLTVPVNSVLMARILPSTNEIELYTVSTASGLANATPLALDTAFQIQLSGSYPV